MDVFIQFDKIPLYFSNPESIISCHETSSLGRCFESMEKALNRGHYLAGFFSYEAGYGFENKLDNTNIYRFPLLSFGAYPPPQRHFPPSQSNKNKYTLDDLRLNVSPQDYDANIEKIRSHIASGDVYQITYCIKLLFNFKGDPWTLYNNLLRRQPVPYPAYIKTDTFHILSLSPEMFLKKREGCILTKPMKGTWPRGQNIFLDTLTRIVFQYDKKNRAENLMITDLLRNDLGRIGRKIRVPRLFEVAGYNTLFQMTSTVSAQIEKRISIERLFSALFPSGSVTGAPKIRAMEIIRQLENEERKIYTGSIGYITPDRDAFFNIPIRTLLIENEKVEMGIGGGIIWDSTPQGEWSEGMLKAKFITDLVNK